MSVPVQARSKRILAHQRKLCDQLKRIIETKGRIPTRDEMRKNKKWPNPNVFSEMGGYEKIALGLLQELREAGKVKNDDEAMKKMPKITEEWLQWLRVKYGAELPAYYEVKFNEPEVYYKLLQVFGSWSTLVVWFEGFLASNRAEAIKESSNGGDESVGCTQSIENPENLEDSKRKARGIISNAIVSRECAMVDKNDQRIEANKISKTSKTRLANEAREKTEKDDVHQTMNTEDDKEAFKKAFLEKIERCEKARLERGRAEAEKRQSEAEANWNAKVMPRLTQIVNMQKYYNLRVDELPTIKQVNNYAKEEGGFTYTACCMYLGPKGTWLGQLEKYRARLLSGGQVSETEK